MSFLSFWLLAPGFQLRLLLTQSPELLLSIALPISYGCAFPL